MGILGGMKQGFDELTGKAERQRQQEAAQKAHAQEAADARAKAESAKQIEADKVRTQAAERSKQERVEYGPPAARMASLVTHGQEDRLRQPRQQQPEPVNVPEVKPEVAEQKTYRPTGLQRGPTIGGGGNVITPEIDRAILRRQQSFQQDQPATPPREATPMDKFLAEKQKSPGQDRLTAAQRQIREQQIRALDQELGRL